MALPEKVAKSRTQFYRCLPCDYITSRKNDFVKHLATDKHLRVTVGTLRNHVCYCGRAFNCRQHLHRHKKSCFGDNSPHECDFYVSHSLPLVSHGHACACGRSYKHASSLSKHKKTCLHDSSDSRGTKTDGKTAHDVPGGEEMMFLLEKIHRDNEVLHKDNQDLKAQVLAVAQDPKYQTNNNLNNFNFFLNEQCGDALSISEFVAHLQVKLSDVEYTVSNGKVAGIANIIQRGFQELGVYKRPVHCTDLKRQTLYVKDKGEWSRDDQSEKMNELIRGVDFQQCKNIKGWEDAHPGCRDRGTKLEELWVAMVKRLTQPLEEKDVNKITRRCTEVIHLDKTQIC